MVSGKHPLSDSGAGVGDSPGVVNAAAAGHPATMEVTLATAGGGSSVRARLSTSTISTPPPAASGGGSGGAAQMTLGSGSSSSSSEASHRKVQGACGSESSDHALATTSRRRSGGLCCDGGCPIVAVALKLCGILTLLAGYAAMFYSGHRLIGSLLSDDTTGAITPLTLGILIGVPVALLPLSCLMVACGRCCDGDFLRLREGRRRRRQEREHFDPQGRDNRNRGASGSPHHHHSAV